MPESPTCCIRSTVGGDCAPKVPARADSPKSLRTVAALVRPDALVGPDVGGEVVLAVEPLLALRAPEWLALLRFYFF